MISHTRLGRRDGHRVEEKDQASRVAEGEFYEYGLIPSEERWAVMVPRLNRLLDKLIEEEADRRLKERSGRPS